MLDIFKIFLILIISFISCKNLLLNSERQIKRENKKYTITYYDGNQKLNITPNLYTGEEEIILPKYKKEGYYFIGWFESDISLYRYQKINIGDKKNLILYARFYSLILDNKIILPESTGHIGCIEEVLYLDYILFQPCDIGSTWPSYNKMDYDWTSSDNNVAQINQYSSITPINNGYTIITGILKTDKSKIINGILKVNGDELTIVREEEANKFEIVTLTFKGKDNETIDSFQMKKGSLSFYPVPIIYDNYSFCGWDKEILFVNENTTINGIYNKMINNRFTGKKISILGDSISTFEGYIPKDYKYFYPQPYGDVRNIYQTWWMKVINGLGAGLYINNAYGGSTVCNFDEYSTSNDKRLEALRINDNLSDVLFIFMGTNDCASKYVNVNTFKEAYTTMLNKLKTISPNSEIILINLPISKLYTIDSQYELNQVIGKCAEDFNHKLIDISGLDMTNTLIDSAHPNSNGMKILSKAILDSLLIKK